MKIQDAFLEIAEAFRRPPSKRTEQQDDITNSGMCLALSSIMGFEEEERDNIYDTFPLFNGGNEFYWEPSRDDLMFDSSCFRRARESDLIRANFCDMMGNLPVEDFEELWRIDK